MIHLGNGRMVLKEHISFILDFQACVNNKSSALFLDQILKRAALVVISEEPVKSLIYTRQEQKETVYYSPISPATLLKRSNETVFENYAGEK